MQPNIIGAKKFVFGIVLNIGGINYYAPVSSIDRKKANKNHLNETINFIKFCVHEIKQTETHKQMLFKNPGSRIQELNKI